VILLDFPGAVLTEASGINDFNQIVGDYRDALGRFHGFFWDSGLFLTFDVPFPDARTTGPKGINNVGQITGSYFDSNTSAQFPNGHLHGFLYNNGEFSSFDFPGAVSTAPSDINDHGTIVGIYGDGDPLPHSFVLDANGTFATLNVPFPNVTQTAVSGINNRGQLVGRYIEHAPSVPNQNFDRGFIATPQGQENATQEENIVANIGPK
jgi:uncharacterized membrane protein